MLGFYDELALYQITEEWPFQEVVRDLHRWRDRYDAEFKLDVRDVAIAIMELSRRRLGHFRRGHNAFGLRGEIAIATHHVVRSANPENWWRILGTLLHELLHAWQEVHGSPSRGNYHNREFRDKARSLGLIVDTRGVTQYLDESPFIALLRQFGVRSPILDPIAPDHVAHSKSKLKLWMCECPVRVRVAVPHFDALCMRCGAKFKADSTRSQTDRRRKALPSTQK